MKNDKYIYSAELNNEMQLWASPEINNPNLLLLQVDNGLSACSEYTIDFAKALTRAEFEKSNWKRSYEQSFLMLKFPKEIGYDNETKYFFDSPNVVAKFYHCFKGWQIIELTDWRDDTRTTEFTRFLNHIRENESNIHYIFIASVCKEADANELFRTLASVIRIKKMCIQFPESCDLTKYALDCLGTNGITVENGANEVLQEFIKTLSSQKSYVGYPTIHRMVENIVYEIRTRSGSEFVSINDMLMMEPICLMSAAATTSINKIGF